MDSLLLKIFESLKSICIYFIVIIIFFAYLCISNVISKSQVNIEVLVLLSCILCSIVIPNILFSFLSPLIIRNNTHYFYMDDKFKWYLVKPLNDTEFIIGDKRVEEDCEKIKFIKFEELKKIEIRIERD